MLMSKVCLVVLELKTPTCKPKTPNTGFLSKKKVDNYHNGIGAGIQ